MIFTLKMSKTKIGFTGTRRKLTIKQEDRLELILKSFNIKEFHHGGCRGADMSAHGLIVYLITNEGLACKIHIHPSDLMFESGDFNACDESHPTNTHWDIYYKPKPPIERNHNIVDATEVLIATPLQKHEVLRSGTWATIRYALKIGRDVVIIYPDGTNEYITARR